MTPLQILHPSTLVFLQWASCCSGVWNESSCVFLWGVDHYLQSFQLWTLLQVGVAERGFSRLTGLLSTQLWLAFSKISGFRSPSLPCPWLGCFGSNWVSGDFQSVKGVRRCYQCFTKSDVDLGISVILVFPVFVKWARSKNVWLPSWKKSMHTWMRRLLSFTRNGDIEVIRQQFMVVNNFFKPRRSGHLLISHHEWVV